jgi:hypothetical protein
VRDHAVEIVFARLVEANRHVTSLEEIQTKFNVKEVLVGERVIREPYAVDVVVARQTDARVVQPAGAIRNLGALRLLVAALVERGGERKTPLTVSAKHMAGPAVAGSIANRVLGEALLVVCARLVEFCALQTSVSLPIRMEA